MSDPSAPHSSAAPAPAQEGEVSKKSAEKAAKKAAEKAAKEAAKKEKEERLAKEAAERDAKLLAALGDRFGKAPLVQSQSISGRVWTDLGDLSIKDVGKCVLIRARLDHVRANSATLTFLRLRDGCNVAQAVVAAGEVSASSGAGAGDGAPPAAAAPAAVPKEAVKWAGKLNPESVVDVTAFVTAAPAVISSSTGDLQAIELAVTSVLVISEAARKLPFQLSDASRPENEANAGAAVGLDVRLNNRWLDLRTPANISIVRITSAVEREFRAAAEAQGFVGVHTPKTIAGASEGGANVFRVDYFGRQACLAQSPQLYKQMVLMGDVGPGVFEVGPVFRAEVSATHRHLAEFMGLDIEMRIHEHYHEVLDVAERMFHHIFGRLSAASAADIATIASAHPGQEPFVWEVPSEKMEGVTVLADRQEAPVAPPSGSDTAGAAASSTQDDEVAVASRSLRMLRLHFPYGARLITEAVAAMSAAERESLGVTPQPVDEDLTTPNERLLGRLVKQRWGVDWFILDMFPSAARPFYTMEHPRDARFTNSYDMFMRGEEISSGAQRIHDQELLLQRAERLGVPTKQLAAYIESFGLGSWPHGGFGVGLERVVMLFLGLPNIRKVSLFPRDFKRLEP
eukprot:TRINITY_DN2792_c0_g1_i1.p1 TRINITY_DN2792_c0_g1~~TRINITY_DN2792_c0_g1_i1.p1  ORF type:complete len:635 (+),score=113.11 TRINITY_DN2792_c0_g1_i1:29-1906(+)